MRQSPRKAWQWTVFGLFFLLWPPAGPAGAMEWVELASDGRTFQLATSHRLFVPVGFNYDHDDRGRLLEDYWENEWETVVEDFREMQALGANVVRIHLQFGAFMEAPDSPKESSLRQLDRLLALAEATGLYLDLTGLGCYHKPEVPSWYDRLTESQRWKAQAVFWSAVAARCKDSPAVFCFDLMNEPIVPGNRRRDDWLGKSFAGKYFVQFITLSAKNRPRPDVARQWIHTLVQAIRRHDRRHLITVGLVPWSVPRAGRITSGFDPARISEELDFLAVHVYPERGKVDEAVAIVRAFARTGKPVVIEEIFPLKCGTDELAQFVERVGPQVSGWIGFYWGKTLEEYNAGETLADAVGRAWLQFFRDQLVPRKHPRP